MTLKRFDVVLVDFGSDVIGSEQGGIRPALVIQNNIGNLHSDTTIVMPCTSKKKNLFQPTHTLLKRSRKSGLTTDSVLLGECIRQISKSLLLTSTVWTSREACRGRESASSRTLCPRS